MGGCLGVLFKDILMKEFIYDENIEGQSSLYKELFDDIDIIKEDLDIFYTAFWNIDLSNSNFVKREEIFTYFEIKITKFNLHFINVFEGLAENDEKLNFCEFVLSMWNILSLNIIDTYSKIFYYISKNNEYCPTVDIRNCILELHETKNIDSVPNLKKGIKDIEQATQSEQMNKNQFLKLCCEYKNFLDPFIINVLYKLKLRLIGFEFWGNKIKERDNDEDKREADYIKDMIKCLKVKNKRKSKAEKLQEDVNKVLDRHGRGQDGDQRHVSKKRESFIYAYISKKVNKNMPISNESGKKEKLENKPKPRRKSIIQVDLTSKKKKSSSQDGIEKKKPSSISSKNKDKIIVTIEE